MRVHVRASYDGIDYDTEDLCAFDLSLASGGRVSKTVELAPKVMFIKVIVENLDEGHDIANLKVTATLGSP